MQEKPTISVLCVDDNRFVAEAVAAKLRLAGGFRWAGSLDSAEHLVETAVRCAPDIILLDVDMPGTDPFEAMRELSRRGSAARVIIFSGYLHPDLLDRAIRIGAWGYITKSDGEEALLAGIHRVAAGEFALSPEVQASM